MNEDFDSKRRLVAQYTKFAVHFDPLVHLPWGLYRIYAGEKYVGAQLSFPSESDCEWIAAQQTGEVIYAEDSFSWHDKSHGHRRGATSPSFLKWRKDKAAA